MDEFVIRDQYRSIFVRRKLRFWVTPSLVNCFKNVEYELQERFRDPIVMNLKLSRGGFIVWGILGSILCYAFLKKWGFLGGYLQASPYAYFGLALYLTIKSSERIDKFFIGRFSSFYFTWMFKVFKGALVFLTFSSVVYVSFFSTMDRLLISKISGVPLQVLLPCSYRTNPPELEQEIRKVWRVHKFDSIDEFCDREIDTSNGIDY